MSLSQIEAIVFIILHIFFATRTILEILKIHENSPVLAGKYSVL